MPVRIQFLQYTYMIFVHTIYSISIYITYMFIYYNMLIL